MRGGGGDSRVSAQAHLSYVCSVACMCVGAVGYLRWFHRFSRAIMVPTPMVQRDLTRWGFQSVVLWSRGVDTERFQLRRGVEVERRGQPPIFLYAGRVAVEKNVEAFLQLDLPGIKWVSERPGGDREPTGGLPEPDCLTGLRC